MHHVRAGLEVEVKSLEAALDNLRDWQLLCPADLLDVLEEVLNALLLVQVSDLLDHDVIIAQTALSLDSLDFLVQVLDLPDRAVVLNDKVQGVVLILLASEGNGRDVKDLLRQRDLVFLRHRVLPQVLDPQVVRVHLLVHDQFYDDLRVFFRILLKVRNDEIQQVVVLILYVVVAEEDLDDFEILRLHRKVDDVAVPLRADVQLQFIEMGLEEEPRTVDVLALQRKADWGRILVVLRIQVNNRRLFVLLLQRIQI